MVAGSSQSFSGYIFFSLTLKLRHMFMLLLTYLMGLVGIAESASMGPKVCAKVVFFPTAEVAYAPGYAAVKNMAARLPSMLQSLF